MAKRYIEYICPSTSPTTTHKVRRKDLIACFKNPHKYVPYYNLAGQEKGIACFSYFKTSQELMKYIELQLHQYPERYI